MVSPLCTVSHSIEFSSFSVWVQCYRVIKPSHCFVLPFLVPGPCDPEDLLDGVVFGAKYLGSTQIKSDKNPSTNARMAQAQEAVDRIKVKMPDMSVC